VVKVVKPFSITPNCYHLLTESITGSIDFNNRQLLIGKKEALDKFSIKGWILCQITLDVVIATNTRKETVNPVLVIVTKTVRSWFCATKSIKYRSPPKECKDRRVCFSGVGRFQALLCLPGAKMGKITGTFGRDR